jgi:hypothetical protein
MTELSFARDAENPEETAPRGDRLSDLAKTNLLPRQGVTVPTFG